MLKLLSLRAKNFRSLENLDLVFHPRITVLLGRNNVGKSNVMDALSFLHSAATSSLQRALSDRGGFTKLVFGHRESNSLSLEVEFGGLRHSDVVSHLTRLGVPIAEWLDGNKEWTLRYRISLSGRDFDETLDLKWENQYLPLGLGTLRSGLYSIQVADFPAAIEALHQAGNLNQLRTTGSSVSVSESLIAFRSVQTSNKYFEIFLSALNAALTTLVLRAGPDRNPAPVASITGNEQLMDSGENLADWLDSLRSNRAGHFAEFEKEYIEFVPEVRKLTTPRLGAPSTTVLISEGWQEGEDDGFDLAASSFGERNMMVLLAFLIDRRPRVILAVEEPENSIHPSAQRILTRTLWRFSQRYQILVSTHSPIIASALPLDVIQFVSKQEGSTKVAAANPANVQSYLRDMGVRPGDVFDPDTYCLVEGESDELAFAHWAESLLRSEEGRESMSGRYTFLSVKGIDNMPLYFDARIQRSRASPPAAVVLTDGDLDESSDKRRQWKRIREQLMIPDGRVFRLQDGLELEDYLLVPRAVSSAYPIEFPRPEEVTAVLQHGEGKLRTGKEKLEAALFERGIRYSPQIAGRIAWSMRPDEINEHLKGILYRIAAISRE